MFTWGRRARLDALTVLATLSLSGCGDPAPPPPAPLAPEFDDPFADEAAPAAPAGPGIAAPAGPAIAAPAEPGRAAPDGPALVGPAIDTPEPPATPVAVVAPPNGEPGPAPSAADKQTAPVRRKPGKESAPVPQDRPPPPAPQAPADSPAAPAPVPQDIPPPAAPVAAPPVVPAHERFAGSYTYAGGQVQRDQMAAGIEATVMALNVLFRPIARKRLTEGNPLREQVSLAVAGETVTVAFGADRKVTGAFDGPEVAWTSDTGSPLTVSFSFIKGRIVMNCVAKDGARRNVFTLDEGGGKLTMSVTMSSERLPVPVKYALTYRRK